MDKKQYEEIKFEVITFTSQDVITTSEYDVVDPQKPGGN